MDRRYQQWRWVMIGTALCIALLTLLFIIDPRMLAVAINQKLPFVTVEVAASQIPGINESFAVSYLAVVLILMIHMIRNPNPIPGDIHRLSLILILPTLFSIKTIFGSESHVLHLVIAVIFFCLFLTVRLFSRRFLSGGGKTVLKILFVGIVLCGPAACVAPKDGDKLTTELCGKTVHLELAISDAKHQEGYMFRDRGPVADDGMLFIFSDESPRNFWMANVKFPLDILYVDRTGTVISTMTMYPEPGVGMSELKRYSSGSPAKYAVEMRKGWLADHKIMLGCKLERPRKIADL